MSVATPVSTVTAGLSGTKDDMLTVAGVGLTIGAAVLVVRKGWKIATGFIR